MPNCHLLLLPNPTGSVTPKPQPGNPKPRVFRIPELKTIVNRYGFNSQGADRAGNNMQAFWQKVEAMPDVKRGKCD